MLPIAITFRQTNLMVQQRRLNSQQISVRIDDSNHVSTHGELFKLADGSWAFVLDARPDCWDKGSSVLCTTADGPELALEDMLAHIRSYV